MTEKRKKIILNFSDQEWEQTPESVKKSFLTLVNYMKTLLDDYSRLNTRISKIEEELETRPSLRG